MKGQFLILCVILFSKSILAQKVINNPDSNGTNFSARVTKVILSDTEIVMYFDMKEPLGSRFLIPEETYIENALDGERVYVKKGEGVKIGSWKTILNSNGYRYKLFFPPLSKDIRKINYGESNEGGSWFIFKLDVTKDGTQFLEDHTANEINGFVSRPDLSKNEKLDGKTVENDTVVTNIIKEIPKGFFGNWYDKYGTLILVATPDYMATKLGVIYYKNIVKTSNTKFIIKSTGVLIEVLDLSTNTIVIKRERFRTLQKGNTNTNSKIPEFAKGDWLHNEGIKKINITNDFFYKYNDALSGASKKEKILIDTIVSSEFGHVFWFLLSDEKRYHLYMLKKIKGKYVIEDIRNSGGIYKKIEN